MGRGTDLADVPVASDFMSPGIDHYENGPVTSRMIELQGRLWSVTYLARRDAFGWLVYDTLVQPEEATPASLRPGELVEIRCKIEQDMGPDVMLRVEGEGYTQKFWTKRSNVTRIHRPGD
ncbi:hypothetical protein [Bradyrhizobium sp. 192]|uniref:hypothetical protein n=1 Tax=Bradyrhizobium sp. 192 TaxID=2782660 RepID=UPI001FFFE148|nr:hypothetical protein [Bradyrhizobium sp. 192]UPJ55432.1 hypothetical protein IVB24_22505 [Bradyrhizobium sp. 192]